MPGKVALITGSSAGLGAAIAKALSRDYRIVINYNSRREKAEEVIRLCTEETTLSAGSSDTSDPQFHIIQADLSSKTDIEKLVQETVNVMGRLDVVVSNVGWTRIVNFHDLEQNTNDEDWDKCFTMNVKSHFWLLHRAKRHLEASPEGGSFLAVASLAGVVPSGSSIAYSVTKAAEIHLLKCLATVCGPKIQCNSISPGLVMSEWGQQFPESVVKDISEKAALKRLTTLEDVAEMVRTMVSSESLTGKNIIMDCGIVI